MKKYIITEEDISKLKEKVEDTDDFWYFDIKLDDWLETLKIFEDEK